MVYLRKRVHGSENAQCMEKNPVCQTFLRPNYNKIEGGQDESSFESIRSPIQMQSTAKLWSNFINRLELQRDN